MVDVVVDKEVAVDVLDLLLLLLRLSLTCLLRFFTSSFSASGGWESSAICAVMVRIILLYSVFFGRLRELKVV